MITRLIALLTICCLASAACSPAEPGEPGVPIDQTHPPHIKAGLWDLTVTATHDVLLKQQICDGGRTIVTARFPSCAPWQAKLVGHGVMVLDDSCADHGETRRLHRTITGDLSSGFAVDDRIETDRTFLPPIMEHRVSIYRYLGATCPAGMDVRRGTY